VSKLAVLFNVLEKIIITKDMLLLPCCFRWIWIWILTELIITMTIPDKHSDRLNVDRYYFTDFKWTDTLTDRKWTDILTDLMWTNIFWLAVLEIRHSDRPKIDSHFLRPNIDWYSDKLKVNRHSDMYKHSDIFLSCLFNMSIYLCFTVNMWIKYSK